MRPHLCRLAILGVDHVDQLELKLLTGPLGSDRDEHDRVVVADQDIVHLRLDRAAGQLRNLAELPDYLRRSRVVARERTCPGDMPDDVLGKVLILQSAQVAAAKGSTSRSDQVVVRLRHWSS